MICIECLSVQVEISLSVFFCSCHVRFYIFEQIAIDQSAELGCFVKVLFNLVVVVVGEFFLSITEQIAIDRFLAFADVCKTSMTSTSGNVYVIGRPFLR